MKLVCTQENLSKGLSIVARISDKNINLPILNNVLLEAKKEGLILAATNLEIGIKTTIRGKIEDEGRFTVQARLLADFINSLKKENVTIVLEDQTLGIKGENHQTTIRGIEATDFPLIPNVDTKTSFSISANVIKDALTQVLYAVSYDDSRPELTGIFMILQKNNCTLVATDSYRLAEKIIPIKLTATDDYSIIIPAKTLQEVLRVLELNTVETATIAINDNQIQFTLKETEVVSRIIAGEYPDYKQIIPKDFKHEVQFMNKDMAQAIKTTSLFCKQGINDVRIALDKRNKDITVNAENSTVGKNVSSVPTTSKNQVMDIVFNYKFLLDGLSHLSGETAVLKTNDATSPALLISPSEKELTYIIMPIKQ